MSPSLRSVATLCVALLTTSAFAQLPADTQSDLGPGVPAFKVRPGYRVTRALPAKFPGQRTARFLEFSADGGRSWAAEPMESVMVDGHAVSRAVPASRYTHLRWVVTGAVAPRTTVTGQFDTRVGGA